MLHEASQTKARDLRLANDAEAKEKHRNGTKCGHADPDPSTEVENPGTVSLAGELASDVTKRKQPSDGECDCEKKCSSVHVAHNNREREAPGCLGASRLYGPSLTAPLDSFSCQR